MIRISNLNLPLDWEPAQLPARIAALMQLPAESLTSVRLARQSIDARKKHDVHYVCSIEFSTAEEAALIKRVKNQNITLVSEKAYCFPQVRRVSSLPPVVVGTGPAGLFAALFLSRAGIPCVLLERGRPVEERTRDVERFWQTGLLNPDSNVQFGEGGAGTFSDGKLTTGIHDPRIPAVLDYFVKTGAPEDILWQQKPHIGTDVLRDVVRAIRAELLGLGCEIRFGHRLTGLKLQSGAMAAVTVTESGRDYSQPCDTLILAPGHSARDTFSMLLETGVPLAPKAFALGVRIEHRQADVSMAQFGPAWSKLPPADYKLACHLPNGRSAFTFCVCPGGQVVSAAAGEERLVTNGMSHRARDGALINGGFLVGVTPADFGSGHPLAGMRFQAVYEKQAFLLGGKNYCAPVQTVKDFLKGEASRVIRREDCTYAPGVTPADLSLCLPDFVTETLRGALPVFEGRLRGFARPGAVMTGVETRSSSPVRILRGEDYQSPVRGLYPCGEGAGYAGGIMSAAVDGIRVAETVAAGGPAV